jgi:hypothetical protein
MVSDAFQRSLQNGDFSAYDTKVVKIVVEGDATARRSLSLALAFKSTEQIIVSQLF